MGDVESAGLVKFDFLESKNSATIKQSVNRINEHLNEEDKIDIENLSLNDQKTFVSPEGRNHRNIST